MSQVKIQGGASGSDNYTILAPATSTGDKTLTLPTATATLASTDANTFTGVQTFPAGSVSAPSITTTGDTNTGVYFPGADSVAITTGGTAAVTVDSGQRTKFPTTIGIGNATPSTSGAGITFPATQSASTDANTLDDYEEGTWTPGVAFGGGTTGITYDSTTGNYVKIGKLVFYNFRIDMSNKGSSSGVATITGFTFTFNSSNTVGALAGVSFSSTDDLTFTANLTGAPVSGGTTLTLVRNVSGGASVDLTNTEFANGTVLRGSIVTMTAS